MEDEDYIEQREANIKDNTLRQAKQYFIDNFGTVIKYNGDLSIDCISMHYEICAECFPKMRDAETHAMDKLGWIMMGSSVYHHPIIHIKPTQAQLNHMNKHYILETLTILYDGRYINYMENYELFD